MTTLTSTGAVNLTASTNWSPAQIPVAGDDLIIAAHTLTLDADMVLNTITFSNASSRLAVSGTTRSVQATNGFIFGAANSAVLFSTSLASGVDLTLTGTWYSPTFAINGIANSTGGNLTLRTVGNDPAAILFADRSSPASVNFVISPTWSSGTLTTVGRFNLSNLASASYMTTISGGAWLHTHSEVSLFGSQSSNVSFTGIIAYAITGVPTITWSGAVTYYGASGFGLIYVGAASGVITVGGGDIIRQGAGVMVNINGGSCTLNLQSPVLVTGRARSIDNQSQSGVSSTGVINIRNMSIAIPAGHSMVIYVASSVIVDMTNLQIANSGVFLYLEGGTSYVIADGSTVITNVTSNAQAAAYTLNGLLQGKIVNLASTVLGFPAAEDVAAGTGSYGYTASPITPTGLIVDPAVIAAGVATGLAAYETNGVASQNDLSSVSVDLSGVIGYLTAISDMLPATPKLAGSADSSGAAVLDSSTRVKLAADQPDYAPATAAALTATLTKIRKFFQLTLRKDAAIAADNAAELTEINADGGTGVGGYLSTSDSQEAIRDNSGGGGGGSATEENQTTIINHLADIKGTGWSSAADTLKKIRDAIANFISTSIVVPGPVLTAVGMPETLEIGDSYEEDASLTIYIRDENDDPVSAAVGHDFTDGDFAPTFIIAPTPGSSRGRVRGTVTYVVPGGLDEPYLKVDIPSSQSKLAVAGEASVQLVLKWTGAEKTLLNTTVRWLPRI